LCSKWPLVASMQALNLKSESKNCKFKALEVHENSSILENFDYIELKIISLYIMS